MNSGTVIRKAERNDLDSIMMIEKKSFKNGWTREMMAEEFGRDDAAVFIAENGAIAAGCSIVRTTDDFAELFRIAVIPEMRKNGIGAALLDTVIEWAGSRKKARLFLEVREDNLPARALYSSKGFIVSGVRKKYYEGTVNAVVMELLL